MRGVEPGQPTVRGSPAPCAASPSATCPAGSPAASDRQLRSSPSVRRRRAIARPASGSCWSSRWRRYAPIASSSRPSASRASPRSRQAPLDRSRTAVAVSAMPSASRDSASASTWRARSPARSSASKAACAGASSRAATSEPMAAASSSRPRSVSGAGWGRPGSVRSGPLRPARYSAHSRTPRAMSASGPGPGPGATPGSWSFRPALKPDPERIFLILLHRSATDRRLCPTSTEGGCRWCRSWENTPWPTRVLSRRPRM